MKGSFLVLCCAGLLLSAPSTVFAGSLASSLGNLRWGMTDNEVVSVVRGALEKEYAPKFKKAKGAARASLEADLKRRLQEFERSHVDFTGRSRWDSTSVGEEFAHGSGESMMALEGANSNNYYFFVEGRLWKWVRTMPSSAFGGYAKFAASIKKNFGKGYEKSGEINAGSGSEYKYIEMLDRNSRLRAVDKTNNHREYALVFEELATARSIASMRGTTPSRSKPRRATVASTVEPPKKTAPAAPKGENARRSIFANEGGDESETDYQARKRKTIEARERKERSMFNRQQDAKKGKVLDGLQGIDDDDPLSGMQ